MCVHRCVFYGSTGRANGILYKLSNIPWLDTFICNSNVCVGLSSFIWCLSASQWHVIINSLRMACNPSRDTDIPSSMFLAGKLLRAGADKPDESPFIKWRRACADLAISTISYHCRPDIWCYLTDKTCIYSMTIIEFDTTTIHQTK